MEEAFLNCNIWSVDITHDAYNDSNFFLVDRIYHYNSLTSGIVVFNPNCIQIPEFEIKELHLLDGLDYDFINRNVIPILCKIDQYWKIDLTHYHRIRLYLK